MLQVLTERYSKPIALVFALLLYTGFLSQLQTAMAATAYRKPVLHHSGYDGLVPKAGLDAEMNRLPVESPVIVKSKPQPGGMKNILSEAAVATAPEFAVEKALIGPGQPEASSFKSAGTDNMVDLFSGDFSYNIPLMDVGGYPIAIHYNSGITMDQEASWVGLGWNINPGTISRNVRGLPDDFNGVDQITKTEKMANNKTVSVNGSISFELFGNPEIQKLVKANLGVSIGLVYNNYKGWGFESAVTPSISANLGGGAGTAGKLSGSLSIASNSMYGASVSPSLSVGLSKNNTDLGLNFGTSYNNRVGMSDLQIGFDMSKKIRRKGSDPENIKPSTIEPFSTSISFATPSYTPTISSPIKNSAYSFTGRITGELWGATTGIGIAGAVQEQILDATPQSKNAYGYMHYTKAQADPEGLMDFNREKEVIFNAESTPHIALPVYTPDVFSITGEGIGGMFRAYRGSVGYVRDHHMKTESDSRKFSLGVGVGTYVHIGADAMVVDASTENREWTNGNPLAQQLAFKENETDFEGVYFKNPGEQTVTDEAFYAAMGDDALIRPKLSGYGEEAQLDNKFDKVEGGVSVGELDGSAPIERSRRDKRTQVINYLTAAQAQQYGFNKTILSYPENKSGQTLVPRIGGDPGCMTGVQTLSRVTTAKKSHHISEVDVLGTDGRKYVYGIPVYNLKQEDLSFSVQPTGTALDYVDHGWVQYGDFDASVDNARGKEQYFSSEVTDPHANAFLLTGIVSPDYVDIRNDGITDDDLGDAVRFNYSQVATEAHPFNWRLPYTNLDRMANYNEAFKSYNRDDKATVAFGQKELWYLHSVESKNYVAVFYVSEDRDDLKSVAGIDGGLSSETTYGARKLDKIELYAKANLAKNGASARPIKTVTFTYDNSLCKNITGDVEKGKLTLLSIRISFNKGKEKKVYHFNYSSFNPDYNPAHYDRWGSYKDTTLNKGALSNYDYPYAVQDSVKASLWASAWNLKEIMLPEGGKLQVTYEADDYGYVQHKRAMRFFEIEGFGNSASATPSLNIYGDAAGEKQYVFVQLPEELQTVSEVKSRYFQDIQQLYCKLFVPMPNTDKWGTGSEWVPLYADIEDIGFVGSEHDRIWIKVKTVEGVSPFRKVAIQFLRLNLPSKAYPNSETGDNVDFGEMIKVIFSSFAQYAQLLKNFESIAMQKGWSKTIEEGRSFVRLDDPALKKLGGGHRVKRIELFDNWNTLTASAEAGASYGQEYDYSAVHEVGGVLLRGSSGVASYEPVVGTDENPFRVAVPNKEKTNLLAPTNLTYSEMPLGESFFPGAGVGYAKIRVRTIHKTVKSANGFAETEFYTAKDFPTMVEYTPLDAYSKKQFRSRLSDLLKIDSRQYMTVSQGFKVELNNMHGKLKTESSYGETSPDIPITRTQYFYRVDNPAMKEQHLNNEVHIATSDGKVSTGTIGKEIELMVDFREQESKTVSGNYGANVDIIAGVIWPIPIPSYIPFPQREIMRFRSAAATKVINRYGILDSIVRIDKGSIVSTRNMVWDAESGAAILNRTNNEFNDPVYSLNYPAYWAYDGMGPAYKNLNIDLGNQPLKLIKGKLYNNDNRPLTELEPYFQGGDEIMVKRKFDENLEPITPMAMRSEISTLSIPVEHDPVLCGEPNWQQAPPNSWVKVWAIDAGEGREKHQGIYFIDQEGRPYSAKEISEFRILRSGRRNLTATQAGAVVSLASPLVEDEGEVHLAVNNSNKVLNASAVTYKNLWKVPNHFYIKDTTVRVVKVMPEEVFRPINVLVETENIDEKSNRVYNRYERFGYVVSSFDYFSSDGWPCTRVGRTLRSKSTLYYDFSALGSNPVINSATINFGISPWPITSLIGRVEGGRRSWPCNNFRQTYDWSTNTRYYNNSVAASWNNAKFINLKKIGPFIGAVSPLGSYVTVSPTSHSNLNCTSLIQNSINDGNHVNGYQFLQEHMNGAQNSFNFLAFDGVNFKFNTAPAITINYSQIQDSTYQLCKQFISDTIVNPYRFGILGNWRVDTSFVYVADRDQRELSSISPENIDLRRDGSFADFEPFWTFVAEKITPSSSTTKWTWTSVENFFNRRGYEMENYDPLNRFNAALYGYSQQLAIAATQNAKYRQAFFDGFEDGDYSSTSCTSICKDPSVFEALTVSNYDSHTGLHSIALAASSNTTASVPLTLMADTAASLSIRVDSSLQHRSTVTPQGIGLLGSYQSDCNKTVWTTRIDPTVNFFWGANVHFLPAFNGCDGNEERVTWKGVIQAPETDIYSFSLNINPSRTTQNRDEYILKVNNRIVASKSLGSTTISLEIGKLYTIELVVKAERKRRIRHLFYSETDHYGFGIQMLWSRTKNTTKVLIPQGALYPPVGHAAFDTTGSFLETPFYCVKLDPVKPYNVILPQFSPVKETQVVVGAWVKLKDDNNNTADNSSLQPIGVNFAGVSQPDALLEKRGVRIEGWQRYERVVSIPAGATAMQFKFQPGSHEVLVDDIRIHPFNSNMKSFVYDPVTLRVMAELDENNYATFYEYDDDGSLMRLKKETERGVMTIKETRNNTQTLIRNNQ